jgi:predicted metal-dependent hydrolase
MRLHTLLSLSLPESDEIAFGGERVGYAICVSARRRTTCLQVYPDGRVRVVTPPNANLRDIRSFVLQRADWIAKQRRKFQAIGARGPRALHDGARLPFLDEELTLRVRPGVKPGVSRLDEQLFLSAGGEEHGRRLLETWYRREAAAHVTARVAHFGARVGRHPARIAIRDQKTRWGSCSPQGTISINWRLLLAPTAVMDYVIVHELCHLEHHNHSARFWAAVGRVLPDYLQRRQHLHAIGYSLAL